MWSISAWNNSNRIPHFTHRHPSRSQVFSRRWLHAEQLQTSRPSAMVLTTGSVSALALGNVVSRLFFGFRRSGVRRSIMSKLWTGPATGGNAQTALGLGSLARPPQVSRLGLGGRVGRIAMIFAKCSAGILC